MVNIDTFGVRVDNPLEDVTVENTLLDDINN